MSRESVINTVFLLVGGLGIFLIGIKNVSEGMQAVAGARLRKLINAVTSNRFVACGLGTAVTSIIQSSSLTTVMLVGMVNAGLMTLIQAIGVTMGADIGTTITGWILATSLTVYGLPMLGVASFFYLFSTRERVRYTAMLVMGLGMVFYGLEMMKTGVEPLRQMPEFTAWFSRFHPTGYFGVLKCCLMGVIVTSILQSSSVTVGLTQVLASQGILDFETSVALVLGHNIGTTITAYLASFGTSRNAKRAAYAHVLIKVIGVAWFTPLFFQYTRILRLVLVHFSLDPEVSVMVNGVEEFKNAMKAVALAHTVFNVINVAVLIWFVDYIAKAVRFLAPDKAQKEIPHLTFLDLRMMDAPAIGIQQSMNEILRMSDDVKKMIVWLRESLVDESRDLKREQHLFHREEVLDVLQKEVVEFLSHLLSGIVPHEVMNSGRQQLRMADEYESISDYVITILKLNIKMRKESLVMSEEGRREVLDLHDRVAEYVEMISEAVREERVEILTKANTRGTEIVRLMKEYRSHHLARVGTENMSPIMSLYYADMLNSYRRIRDHALNIAEVVAGEK